MSLVHGGNIVRRSDTKKHRSAIGYLAFSTRPYAIGIALIILGLIYAGVTNAGSWLVHTTPTTFTVEYPSWLVDLPGLVLTIAGVLYIGRQAIRHDKYFRNFTRKKKIEVVVYCTLGSLMLAAFGVSMGYAAQNQRVADWGYKNFGLAHFNDYLPAPLPIFNGGIAPNSPWLGSSDVTYMVQDASGKNLRLHYVASGNGSYTLTATR